MITLDYVIKVAAFLTACGGIITIVFKLVRWMDRQAKQDKEICALKEEQQVICYAMLACLDGLKQLGANGNVTKAHDRLEKHLNDKAHKSGG
jgi:K+-transporting ATPase A subunit